MSKIHHDLAAAVDKVARRYKRRCWWTDEEDLRQEAWLHALAVRENYKQARAPSGTIKPLVHIACVRGVSRQVLRDSAPVSSSDHDRYHLIGLHRAPLEKLADHYAPSCPERETERAQWRNRVVARLHEILEESEVAAVLKAFETGGDPPLDAISKVAADAELRAMWEGPKQLRVINVSGSKAHIERAIACVPTAKLVQRLKSKGEFLDANVEVDEEMEDNLTDALDELGVTYELV